MKILKSFKVPVLLGLLLVSSFSSRTLFALGFENTAVGMREITMGGAVTAIADYPSATYWNPAGLVNQEGDEWRYNVYTYVNKAYFVVVRFGCNEDIPGFQPIKPTPPYTDSNAQI